MRSKGPAVMLLVAGLALGFLAGRHDARPVTTQRVEGTVQALTSDGDAFAFTEQDGTTASFVFGRTDGVRLVRPGARLALTYVEIPGSTLLLAVEPAP